LADSRRIRGDAEQCGNFRLFVSIPDVSVKAFYDRAIADFVLADGLF
jgi:hypothetical protein